MKNQAQNTARALKSEIAKDEILLESLDNVPFDGWTLQTIENAAAQLGYESGTVRALFPAGLNDVLIHFSDWADRMMLDFYAQDQHMSTPENMRVRDRIRNHVLARLEVLEPHKESVRLAAQYWKLPHHSPQAAKAIWNTADTIWQACGDTASDYNRYTKRALLSGILSATTLVWLRDSNEGYTETREFLDRRIENVMQFGKIIGKLKR